MSNFTEFKPSKNFGFRLNREKLNEIKRVFDVYDDDYDGLMHVSCLSSLMRVVGLFPSEKEMITVIKAIDTEGTETVSLGQVFILIAKCFRDIGEIEQSTKNSLSKVSYEPDAPAKSKKKHDKGKQVKQVVFEDDAPKEEKKKVISIQTLQNSILDQSGEPLKDEECEEFVRNIPKKFTAQFGDVHLDMLTEHLLYDMPQVDSSTSNKKIQT